MVKNWGSEFDRVNYTVNNQDTSIEQSNTAKYNSFLKQFA